MTDRSKVIFGNVISDAAVRKAAKSKKKFMKKYGDDSNVDYKIRVRDNEVIGPILGVKNIEVGRPQRWCRLPRNYRRP